MWKDTGKRRSGNLLKEVIQLLSIAFSAFCHNLSLSLILGDEITTEAIILKCNINVTSIGWPLVLAAERGKHQVFFYAFKIIHHINFTPFSDKNCLIDSTGYVDVAKILIDNNADVNARDVLDIPIARYGIFINLK